MSLVQVLSHRDDQNPYSYWSVGVTPLGWNDDTASEARNLAYAKFKDKIGDPAGWLVNLIEAEQAIGSIASKATQLYRMARAIRKGHFIDAGKAIGHSVKPKGVSVKKSFANNWLEYHFGWEPLVKDIGSSMELLCSKNLYDPVKVSVRSKSVRPRTKFEDYSDPWEHRTQFSSNECRCRMDATIVISNPNAFLLSQMGFVNPLSVAWDLVPFSFCVDWFLNVGDILSSWTDFNGIELRNAFTTLTQSGTFDIHRVGGPHFEVRPWRDIEYMNASAVSFMVKRGSGISTPDLRLKPFKGVSVVRATTAIALLTQFLKSA